MAQVTFTLTLTSLELSHDFGLALGRALLPGEHLGLQGGMGAGKTTLTRSMAEGFGVLHVDEVASPTYAYAHVYGANGRSLCHMDFYRVSDADSALALGLDDLLQDRTGATIVEWADRFPELLHPEALWLKLSREPPSQERHVVLRAPAHRALALALAMPPWVGPYETAPQQT